MCKTKQVRNLALLTTKPDKVKISEQCSGGRAILKMVGVVPTGLAPLGKEKDS